MRWRIRVDSWLTCKLQVSVCQGGLKLALHKITFCQNIVLPPPQKSAPPPRLALLVYNWSRVLHEVVDQHWPGALQLHISDNMTVSSINYNILIDFTSSS